MTIMPKLSFIFLFLLCIVACTVPSAPIIIIGVALLQCLGIFLPYIDANSAKWLVLGSLDPVLFAIVAFVTDFKIRL